MLAILSLISIKSFCFLLVCQCAGCWAMCFCRTRLMMRDGWIHMIHIEYILCSRAPVECHIKGYLSTSHYTLICSFDIRSSPVALSSGCITLLYPVGSPLAQRKIQSNNDSYCNSTNMPGTTDGDCEQDSLQQ